MRVVQNVVLDLDLLSESGDSKGERVPNKALASLTIAMLDTKLVTNISSLKVVAAHTVPDTAWEGSAGSPSSKVTKAWDALPAPALVIIGDYLPSGSLAAARMVCKAWASHLSEVLKEAAPVMFPMLAHQMARKDGEKCVHMQSFLVLPAAYNMHLYLSFATAQMLAKGLTSPHDVCIASCVHIHLMIVLRYVSMSTTKSAAAGNNTMMTHLMREAIRCHHHSSQGSLTQMLQTVSKHAGLQAALHQQVSDSVTSWHAAINQLFVSCPFLTKLDLSKCTAVVSADDYALLTLQPSDMEAHTSDQSAAPTSSGSSASIHPCANVVINQQALPINIKHLLPILRRLPCLAALHVQLTKVCVTYTV